MTLKNAKKIYFTLLAAVTVSGFVVICTLGQTVHRSKVETRLAAAVEKQVSSGYVVRESSGRIVVFKDGSEKPYIYVDYDVSLLSDYDREQLFGGLYFSTEAELRRYIEDISS